MTTYSTTTKTGFADSEAVNALRHLAHNARAMLGRMGSALMAGGNDRLPLRLQYDIGETDQNPDTSQVSGSFPVSGDEIDRFRRSF